MKKVSLEWITFALALALAGAVTACNRKAEVAGPVPNPEAIITVDKLPRDFYGVWTFQGSSGGMDGQGNKAYRVEKIVIRDGNLIEEHHPEGNVTRDTFSPARGKSIFSTGDVWQIRRKKSSMIEVLTLSTNGGLTISENVYDGFSYSFRRTATAPLAR